MSAPQTAMPSRSWSLVPPDGAQFGGAEVTVSDDGVLIALDQVRPERYQCGLEEYLTAVPLAGHSALRDIVRRTLPETDAQEIADEVKLRLHGRPLRHVGEATPKPARSAWAKAAVLLLLALALAALAATYWRSAL